MQRGLAGAQSVFELIDSPAEPDTGSIELKGTRGRIELRSVCFSYSHTQMSALQDVSLEIQPGDTIALVGSSGSGKTTIAHLIPRFYLPQKGQILIDGHDLADITLTSLRRNIALVSQDVVLFDDTLAANIAYGPLAGASKADIEEAARSAYALSFIEQLPQGFDTVIGQNGVRLSGGQRQRITLARAFLKDAPNLILDEATSSLDAVSEQEIQNAIESLRHNRTTIVIAHKLSTIEKADRIVVMNDGRIVASGKHWELLEENSMYAALYRFQFSSPSDDAPTVDNGDDHRPGQPL